MIGRALKLEVDPANEKQRFQDQESIAPYAVDYIHAMAEKGYITGNSKWELMPRKAITRAEGITVLHRSSATKPASDLKDGVYIGTGAGYGGTIKLEVTVAGGKIQDIKILSHSETPAYFNRVKKILDKIIENQGVDGIDTISGATISSKGILTAVSACVSQAKGGPDTSKTGAVGGGGGGAGKI